MVQGRAANLGLAPLSALSGRLRAHASLEPDRAAAGRQVVSGSSVDRLALNGAALLLIGLLALRWCSVFLVGVDPPQALDP